MADSSYQMMWKIVILPDRMLQIEARDFQFNSTFA
jgi:hypothetical protein